jgi:pyridoxal phosphate enzyme (YggS family)
VDLKQSIEAVRQKIDEALLKAGRPKDDVTLIAVTKNVEAGTIQKAISLGLTELGENRVQELISKHDRIDGARWHMIGRLQRNKVKYIVDKAAMIHSLDSLPLAREINRQAEKIQRVVQVLVQVNPANEESKAGLPYEEVKPFIETLYNMKYIRVMGLMLIAPQSEVPEAVRPYFTMMKQLFDGLKRDSYPHTDFQYLSMGMTNDFETAIEEGSNMVRIGTALFGRREREEK